MTFNEKVVSLLSTVDPTNFGSKADIYRFLAFQGIGDKEMLKSRYKRDTEDFKSIVDTFITGKVGVTPSEDVSYVSYSAPKVNYGELMDKRHTQYLEYREKKIEELERKHIYIPGQWSCVMHFSDPHLDDMGSNIRFLASVMKEFQELGAKFVNLGDMANWWVQSWSSPIALKSATTPEDAYNAIMYILEIMGADHKVFINGNHDEFLNKTVGFNFIERAAREYAPDVLYGENKQVVKFHNDTGESCWINYSHFHKSGKSKNNPHQSNMNFLREKEDFDVELTYTGHFHWEKAAYADAPFPNRNVQSVLLGSIKGYDDYAQGLGFKSPEATNPFAFHFNYEDTQMIITDIEAARKQCEMLNLKYG